MQAFIVESSGYLVPLDKPSTACACDGVWTHRCPTPTIRDSCKMDAYLSEKYRVPGLTRDVRVSILRPRTVSVKKCIQSRPRTRQLSPEKLAKTDVRKNTIRLSIEIEHIDDLLADLDQALAV